MNRTKIDQSGFGVIEFVLIIVIVGIMGSVGGYVWHAKQATDKNLANTTSASSTFKKLPKVSSVTVKSATAMTPTSTASTPASTSTVVQPSPPALHPYTLLYRIISSDNSAQLSPTNITFSNVSGVAITVNLTCVTTCQFKLASDNFAFSNTATYTSSQAINYQLDKKGTYLLYNQYNPSVKTKLTIN